MTLLFIKELGRQQNLKRRNFTYNRIFLDLIYVSANTVSIILWEKRYFDNKSSTMFHTEN